MNKIELLKEYKRLLIVVDMVKGFVNIGPMADSYINHITPEIIKLINDFENDAFAFIKDNHEKDALEFNKYPIHCVIGTDEALLIDELQPYEQKGLVYEKNSTSTMFAPNFMNDIKNMYNLKEIVVTGCCTDICVMNLVIPLINYLDQMNRDIKVVVLKSAVETYNADWHKRDEWNDMAFKFMNQAGALIVNNYNELKVKEKELKIR